MSIWDPVSIEGPKEADLRENEELLRFLDSVIPLASPQNLVLRKKVFDEIQNIAAKFVHDLAVQQALADEIVRVAGCKLFAFGSFKLGVVSDDSDMDLLLVAPKHVSRELFFSLFPKVLAEYGASEGREAVVADLQVVADAQTPVINFRFRGIPVDLLFGRVNQTALDPRTFSLEDDNLLKNLDDKTVRSLNGSRVAEELLRVVSGNFDNFRHALRFIKYHAKQRGLYGNAIGMLGGITYAILLARVVQMYPKFSALMLVRKFFVVFTRWNWRHPVYLSPIEFKTSEVGFGNLKVWNPRQYLADRAHLFPIITPAFPAMCSTYNVTLSAKNLLLSEWTRLTGILVQSEVDVTEQLSKATEKPDFFSSFPCYLSLETSGVDERTLAAFRGFVESRVKLLVKLLEQTEGVKIVRVWPDAVLGNFYIGLSFPPNSATTVDLRPAVATFLDKCQEYFSDDTKSVNAANLAIAFFRQKNLPEALTGRKPQLVAAAAAAAAAAAGGEFAEMQEAEIAAPAPKRRRLDNIAIEI
jgi:poly(A) polymerase